MCFAFMVLIEGECEIVKGHDSGVGEGAYVGTCCFSPQFD